MEEREKEDKERQEKGEKERKEKEEREKEEKERKEKEEEERKEKDEIEKGSGAIPVVVLKDILPESAEPPKKKAKKVKKKKGSGKSKKGKAKKGKGKKSKAKKTPEVAEEEVTDSVNGKRKAEDELEESAGVKKRRRIDPTLDALAVLGRAYWTGGHQGDYQKVGCRGAVPRHQPSAGYRICGGGGVRLRDGALRGRG